MALAYGGTMERVAKQLSQQLSSFPNHSIFKFYPQLSHGDTLHIAVYDAFKELL